MHSPGSRTLLALALAVAFAETIAAQSAGAGGRKPTFALVVDDGGEPVAGAEVTFAGGSPHLGDDVLPVDVQVVASDARGRARARLLPGLCYVAWALGPADADGRLMVSEPAAYFGAGAMLELRCRGGSMQRLEVAGTAAWDDLGPLCYYLVTPHPGVELALEAAADGSFLLPPLPAAIFEVRTPDDRPLWSRSARDLSPMPPPRRVRVRAVDENGAPVPGARIRYRVGRRAAWRLDGINGLVQSRLREVGTTDAAGEADIVVPYATDPMREPSTDEMILFVDAPGRAVVAGGAYGKRRYVDDRRVEEFEADELVFTLPQVGRVAAHPGIVPAGTVAQLVAVCKLRSGGNSYMHDARVFTAEVGDDGVLAFDNVPTDVHSLRLGLLLPEGPTPCMFAGLTGRVLPPELTLARPERLAERVGAVALRVFDVGGGPARGVVASVVPASSRGVLQSESMFRFPLDSAGRGSALLGFGKWVAIVVTGSGYCAVEFELQAGTRELELRLEALATMQMVLRDHDGGPVSGARVRIAGSRTHSTADPRQRVLQQFSRQMRQQWNELQTDADGNLVLPFVPADGVTWTVSLHWPGGSTDKFVVEATDTPVELQPK